MDYRFMNRREGLGDPVSGNDSSGAVYVLAKPSTFNAKRMKIVGKTQFFAVQIGP
jgi:hypothetical protein